MKIRIIISLSSVLFFLTTFSQNKEKSKYQEKDSKDGHDFLGINYKIHREADVTFLELTAAIDHLQNLNTKPGLLVYPALIIS